MLTSMRSLTYVVLLTALMWTPYIADQCYANGQAQFLWLDGLWTKMQYADEKKLHVPMHPWAARAAAAHKNAVENLVLFAPLVFLCHIAAVDADLPALVYLVGRLFYWPMAVLGPTLPVGRTLAFGVGWLACIWMVCLVL